MAIHPNSYEDILFRTTNVNLMTCLRKSQGIIKVIRIHPKNVWQVVEIFRTTDQPANMPTLPSIGIYRYLKASNLPNHTHYRFNRGERDSREYTSKPFPISHFPRKNNNSKMGKICYRLRMNQT